MKRIFLILFSVFCPLLVSQAQEMKPCGTSILARRHKANGQAPLRSRLRKAPQQTAYLGEKRGLIILVEFPDARFKDEDPRRVWSDIVNLEGYSDPDNKAPGSVSDYFRDQSYGQFRLTFDLVGPVEAQHEYAYYGQNIDWGAGDWFDQNVGELVEEACKAVSGEVRFADYDWNADGEVDQVFLLYAGHGENDYSDRDSAVIWPHMGALQFDWEGYPEGLTLQDGYRINVYACSNEISRNGRLAGIGTIAHEFSHCLGLPDLYNTETGGTVLGRYDVMDQGNYNGSSWCPVGYSSYERYACGWLMPTPDESPHLLTPDDLQPLHQTADARIYPNTEATDYYLVELRKKQKWDTFLPQEGLLVWHVDYDADAWRENTVNNDPGHLRVARVSLGDLPTGIEEIQVSGATPTIYYDLRGHRFTSAPPQKGLYIVPNYGTPGQIRIHR